MATFNSKMVAIKKKFSHKRKPEGEDTSQHVTQRANVANGTFSTLHIATSSLPIHVEFLNNERGKEKDR